ncbi:unnamed protein product, partial [Ilex paraguariensis]
MVVWGRRLLYELALTVKALFYQLAFSVVRRGCCHGWDIRLARRDAGRTGWDFDGQRFCYSINDVVS